jgi:hypothetical protein
MATKEEDTEEVMFENKFTRYRKGALVGTKSGFAFIVYPMPSVGYFDDPLVARRDQASALGGTLLPFLNKPNCVKSLCL